MSADPLLAWRREFPSLERSVHMISHSLGAMPARAAENLAEYSRTWVDRSIRAWSEGWWDMPVTVGNLIARIIGAGEGEVTMQPNVSIAQSIVLSCFDFSGRRNKIVTETLNFPTNGYIHHALERTGARVAAVPVEALLDSIDEETLLVSVSHVLFRSSWIQDLAAIARRAREVGAMVMADLYQSAGSVPVNVRELGIEFACGGSVKWLCGGPGAGYLYVRRDLWPKLEPRVTGWMAHRAPFAFEPGPIDYADDVFRFLHGTPAIPALYAAKAGYEIIAEIGVEAIRAKSMRQTALIAEIARAEGFELNGPARAEERGGTVVIDVPDGKRVTEEMLRRDFLVDFRPGAGIRVAPHFYSTDDECRATVAEMARIARG